MTATASLPDLPEDDLDAAITGQKDMAKLLGPVPGTTHSENCSKCRGTGRFIGYTGREVGACRKCNGTGKLSFRTSATQRAAGRASAAASTQRKAEENLAKFEAEHPTIKAWWTGNSFAFAVAMREAVMKYGDLTERQFAAAQGAANKLSAAKEQGAARLAKAQAVDTSKIEAAFAKASSVLKNPKLRAAGLVLSFAKAGSANAGALYVKSATRTNDEGNRLYLGKIQGGKFITSRDCAPEEESHLLEVANDPLGAAIAYGRLTGNCACCGRQLTDPESVSRGIGPVCAENFGWGG